MTYRPIKPIDLSSVLRTPSPADPFPWYVVETAPGREEQAARELIKSEVDVFIPFRTIWKRVGRRTKIRHKPVGMPAFFNYIFATFADHSLAWPAMLGAQYVSGIIGVDGAPYAIGPHDMAEIADRSFAGDFNNQAAAKREPLAEGDSVRFKSGPLRGYDFKIEKLVGPNASLMIDMLGKKQLCKISLDALVGSL